MTHAGKPAGWGLHVNLVDSGRFAGGFEGWEAGNAAGIGAGSPRRWAPWARVHEVGWREFGETGGVMRRTAVLVLFGLFGVAVLASAAAPVPEPVLEKSFEWFSPPGNPGLKAAWVVGAEQASGLYALRVRLITGARIAPHTHPDARYSTVLSGTLYVGFGSMVDESAMIAVPAGAVYVVPANQPHFLWARDGEVVYQESGMGPTGTAAVAGQ